MSSEFIDAAHRLEGVKLNNGWVVGERLATGRYGNGSGGFFSVSYAASNGIKTAFLKAFNIFESMNRAEEAGRSITTEMLKQVQAYEFEASLHELCEKSKMKRIVRVLDHGQVRVDPLPNEQFSTVPYMIMEFAEKGDIRSYINKVRIIDIQFKLLYLKDVALGINQLHSINVAHQDLKPSNIMIFSEDGAKIGDLGRASRVGVSSLHDQLVIAGDRTYAPPEQLYGYEVREWLNRRQRCDLYQFGSLICFLFFGVTLNASIKGKLPNEVRPPAWGGEGVSYMHALPYLKKSFNEILEEFRMQLPEWLAEGLVEIIRQCGNPDYNERGYHKTIKYKTPILGLDRFVSKLDLLSNKAIIVSRA